MLIYPAFEMALVLKIYIYIEGYVILNAFNGNDGWEGVAKSCVFYVFVGDICMLGFV